MIESTTEEQEAKAKHRVSLNAWLYTDRDQALIDAIARYVKQTNGDRATLVVRAVEVYLAVPEEERRDKTESLAQEIAFLREAINNLPSRLLSQLTSAFAGMVVRGKGKQDTSELDTQPVVTDEELAARRQNRRENKW